PAVSGVLDIQGCTPGSAGFTPLSAPPIFLVSPAIPPFGLGAVCFGFLFQKIRRGSPTLRGVDPERRLLLKTKNASVNPSGALQAAVRLLELDCEMRSLRKQGTPPSLEEWINGDRLPAEIRRDLRDLVDARSARIYGRQGPESLTEEERSRIVTLLNRWRASA